MVKQANTVEEFFRNRFETFKKLSEEMGEEKALKKMFEDYSEKIRERMGQYIDNTTLAEGLRNAIPEFEKSGWKMEIVDISNNGMDAALEIQKVCPAMDISREFGYEKPCFLVCDPDGPAIKVAFPEMKAEKLCQQADGDCICMFKFERKA